MINRSFHFDKKKKKNDSLFDAGSKLAPFSAPLLRFAHPKIHCKDSTRETSILRYNTNFITLKLRSTKILLTVLILLHPLQQYDYISRIMK